MKPTNLTANLTEEVQAKYGAIARDVQRGARASCCGDGAPGLQTRGCGCGCDDPISSNLYTDSETTALPAEAVAASLGCGNPTALAALRAGETVLDLGSGGGIDVLLSAKRVGPTGKAYGLDMTEDMLALARENQRRAGVANVEFLKGAIEQVPLPDRTVDVVISNCVINLSGDKDRVLAEAFRVLKPGGRFAVSDVVSRRPVPSEVRRSMELWIGCVAGALDETDYRARLERAGFVDVDIETVREYRTAQARDFLAGAGLDADALASSVDGAFASAFIRARKPVSE
jgi:arsenite methyltransferase